MNCEQAELFMMKFFDGEYNELEYVKFEEHLKCCKKCTLDFTGMEEVLSAVETDGLTEAPDDLESKVMAKVRYIKNTRRQKTAKWKLLLYNSVAVISVIFMAVFLSGKNLSDLLDMWEQIAEYAISFRGLIQLLPSITIRLVASMADTLHIFGQVGTAIIQEYVYMVAALILVALGMKKLYTN